MSNDIDQYINDHKDLVSNDDVNSYINDHSDTDGLQYSPDNKQVTALQAAGLNWGGPVTGIQKGATLGFGDELAALSGTLGAKSGGDKRGFWDIYKDVKGTVNADQKSAEEQHPIASTAGEFAGGMLVPAGLFGKGLAPGAQWGNKALNMAKTGAIAGGITNLGNSEADLTSGNPDQLLEAGKDTAGGVLTGGLLGGTMSLAGSSLGGIGKSLKSYDLIKDTSDVFNRTKAGQQLIGKVEEFSQKNRDLARTVINDLRDLRIMSGEFLEQNLDELGSKNIKVDIKKRVDEIRTRLSDIVAHDPKEREEIENFKKVLSSILDEEEKTVTKFAPKSTPPKPGSMDKATNSVTKRTAEAGVKDQIKSEQLQELLDNEMTKETPDEDRVKRLGKMILKLKNNIEFPPQTITDDVTGLDVSAVTRGEKSPIVSAAAPTAESTFTPIQRLETKSIVPNVTEGDPTAINNIIRSLEETKTQSQTRVGRKEVGEAISAFKNDLAKASAANPEAAPILDQVNASKSAVHNVAGAQEGMLIPDSVAKGVGAIDEQTRAVDAMQNMIKNFQNGGSQDSQKIKEAMAQLEKVYPGSAARILREISEGSRSEYLSRELTKGSDISRDATKLLATGKSAILQGAHAAGTAVNKVSNATNSYVAEPAKFAAKHLVNLGNKVYDQSPEAIKNMAEVATKAGKPFANVLNKIAAAPVGRKKALMFTLMQQPDFREFAHSLMPGDEDKEK